MDSSCISRSPSTPVEFDSERLNSDTLVVPMLTIASLDSSTAPERYNSFRGISDSSQPLKIDSILQLLRFKHMSDLSGGMTVTLVKARFNICNDLKDFR